MYRIAVTISVVKKTHSYVVQNNAVTEFFKEEDTLPIIWTY